MYATWARPWALDPKPKCGCSFSCDVVLARSTALTELYYALQVQPQLDQCCGEANVIPDCGPRERSRALAAGLVTHEAWTMNAQRGILAVALRLSVRSGNHCHGATFVNVRSLNGASLRGSSSQRYEPASSYYPTRTFDKVRRWTITMASKLLHNDRRPTHSYTRLINLLEA